jgi:hypothetical protein
MFKKKLIAFGLCVAMLGSMAACGSSSSSSSSSSSAASTDSSSAPASSDSSSKDSSAAPTSDSSSAEPDSAGSTETAPGGKTLRNASADHSAIDAGSIVNFEDGSTSFVKYNETDWSRAFDATISVADAYGSKALKVVRPKGGVPVVALDAGALLGAEASKCKSISLDLGIIVNEEYKSQFPSCSGTVRVFDGEKNKIGEVAYSNYSDRNACKTVYVNLNGTLTEGSYIYISGFEDTAKSKYADFIMDNVIFYDGTYDDKANKVDGNALKVDSSKAFSVAGFGEFDWSGGTKAPTDERVLFMGKEANNNWWPVAANSFSLTKTQEEADADDSLTYAFNPEEIGLVPGSVLTIYYEVPDFNAGADYQWHPYFRIQNVPEQVPAVDENGNPVYKKDKEGNEIIDPETNEKVQDTMDSPESDGSGWCALDSSNIIDCDPPTALNESYNIYQITYEDIVALHKAVCEDNEKKAKKKADKAGVECTYVMPDFEKEPWTKYADFVGVADRGMKINILAVTIGKASN